MSEKKPSVVRSAVQKLVYSSEQIENDVQKRLGKTVYYSKVTARLQEALVNSSLAIFNASEDIEYCVLETIALVNLRLTGLQGRTRPELAQLHGLWQEMLSYEWMPLLDASRMVKRRLALLGRYDLWKKYKNVDDIVKSYGRSHIIQYGFRLLARSFGEESEIPQFVVLATQVVPQQIGKEVTIKSSSE